MVVKIWIEEILLSKEIFLKMLNQCWKWQIDSSIFDSALTKSE
jgi:hypothetical protein